MLVLCKQPRVARLLYDDLRFYLPEGSVFYFPSWDMLPLEAVSPQVHISAERIRALHAMREIPGSVCIAPVQAALQRIFLLKDILSQKIELSIGSSLERENFISSLIGIGFRRCSLVEDVGEFAVRGGVIDIFPSTTPNPVRIELFGNQIERLTIFNTESQRSISALRQFHILPVSEAVLPASFDSRDGSNFESRLRELAELRGAPTRLLNEMLEDLRIAAQYPGIEWFAPLTLPKDEFAPCLLDLLSATGGQLVIDDLIGLSASIDSYDELVAERELRAQQEGWLIPLRSQIYLQPDQLLRKIESLASVEFDTVETISAKDEEIETTRFQVISNLELSTRVRSKIGTGSAFDSLGLELERLRAANFCVVFAVGSEQRGKRLQKLLLDLGWQVEILTELSFQAWNSKSHQYPIVILLGHLHAGFQARDAKLCVISESEIFGERSYKTNNQSAKNLKKLLGTLSQLKEGDFIVHSDFGIGVYGGLVHREVAGKGADLVKIEYADSVLFLPIHNIGKIQKFSAAEGQKPTIDKLSSQRWTKTKEKVRQRVISIAGELIKLYATRNVTRGWRFDPYGSEDERFADDFPYNETPDQLQAIQETLSDMASEKPMDRLVCGDVGFGKTEVALRAAYKCTQHGRQVAVLAPTTILVEQHRQTFQKRLVEYPLRIEALSRFYPPAKNVQVLEQLKSGEIDIVIGTHKLLQKDVIFKDLGLLIIDEEHRFGVKQKERMKQIKKSVDVLTLTATPIPRTLHMSLLEIRDISLISTPPTDRRTVRTYTANWDEPLIRDAIMREIQRNGQVFYVHNRVQGIDLITAELKKLVPEARFQFAHGQMKESQLEKIMLAFLQHEIDVLVCTTIIESGIDIPNANTMLINRADMFGLAQLYQLRGRVGRSDRQAYCYFLVPHTKKLGAEAQERLKALQSLDDLGQGFQLAIRDLEIRGAGNLLGKEQSGSVAAVGFDLFTKILKEAVLHLKGLDSEIEVDPEISIDADAYIPESYIPDISERLILYQRLSSIEDEIEANLLLEEIEDRFGPPGPEISHLIDLMTFRIILKRYGVIKADINPLRTLLSFDPRANINLSQIMRLVQQDQKKYRFSKGLTLSVRHLQNTPHYRIYQELGTLLQQIAR